MKNFSIDARQIKAAMTMQAKNDIRYYLNGILIGGCKVVATDGHRLIAVDSPEADFESKIFTIKGRLSKKAMRCEFVFIGDDYGVVMSKDGLDNDIDAVVKFSVVDGKFPDYKRAIPVGEPDKISEVGFNIGYLADVNKAAIELVNPFGGGKFSFYGTSVLIDINTPENKATCVIMAMRL